MCVSISSLLYRIRERMNWLSFLSIPNMLAKLKSSLLSYINLLANDYPYNNHR
jgi:hypothetical protein